VTNTAVPSREVLSSELHSLLKSPKKQRSCPKKFYARRFILRGESAEYAWGTFWCFVLALTRSPSKGLLVLLASPNLFLYISWLAWSEQSVTRSYSATSVSVKRWRLRLPKALGFARWESEAGQKGRSGKMRESPSDWTLWTSFGSGSASRNEGCFSGQERQQEPK
jgi:hypothetical protein